MAEIADQTPWDPTYREYFQLADLLKSIAESHCHVAIDDDTLLRWRELMGVMRELDTQADDTPASEDSILEELHTFNRFRQRYPHIAPESMGQVMRERLLRRTERILKLGTFVTQAASTRRYIHLRAAEAVQTANIFADSASERVLAQDAFTERFMPVLRSMGIAACMLDSAHDAPGDYASGKSNIEPAFAFRLRALGTSMYHAASFVGAGFHGAVTKELWHSASIRHRRKKY